MTRRTNQIDLVKLALYLLKRCWLIIICAAIGFGGMYWRTARNQVNTYTARATMYVSNSNPNLINYQYASASDLNSAVQLLDTYLVVIRSNKVMDVMVERLSKDYPGITADFISASLSMGSVSETGVLEVRSVTGDPQLSADICNTVVDVAPEEIIRVVGAGSVEVIDYATPPVAPDARNPFRRAMRGALAGAVAAGALLVLLFLLNNKITDTRELTDNYTPPILATVRRRKKDSKDPVTFMLGDDSPMENVESYAKLRMNLLYTLVGKEHHTVVVTSAISGEGKSTISANLAISCAMGGKRTLLIDSDMRRSCQRDIFRYPRKAAGLSDVLVGNCKWQRVIRHTDWDMLDVMPAGQLPPNPAELLGSKEMRELLDALESRYELILLDMPPINIVSDPLVFSDRVGGCIFVVRQNYSDHREVRKALKAAEMTGMNVLGFVFYGENLNESGYYYNRKYYRGYYHKYDSRRNYSTGGNQRLTKNGDGESDERHEGAKTTKSDSDPAVDRASVRPGDE